MRGALRLGLALACTGAAGCSGWASPATRTEAPEPAPRSSVATSAEPVRPAPKCADLPPAIDPPLPSPGETPARFRFANEMSKGYTFRLQSSHPLTIDRDGDVDLLVAAFEQGGPTTPLEQRPALRFASLPRP